MDGPLCKQLVTDTEPSARPSDDILSRCVVGSWSEWGPCTKDCRPPENQLQPFQWISRTVTPIRPGVDDCQDVSTFCTRPCPESVPLCQSKECVMGEWGPWSNCSEPFGERTRTCGRGFTIRTRKVLEAPEGYDPRPCPETYEIQQCSESGCNVGCVVGLWGPWSACTASCDGGVQTRRRKVEQKTPGEPRCTITDPETGQERAAPGFEPVQSRRCNEQPCGADCEYYDWQPVGPCSKDCGEDGEQRFTKFVKVEGTGDGIKCLPPSHPDLNKMEPCNRKPCPPDAALQQHLSDEAKRLADLRNEGGETPPTPPAPGPAPGPSPAPAPAATQPSKPKAFSRAWFDGLELWLKILLIVGAVVVALLLLWLVAIALGGGRSRKGKREG
jgi:hypothetical protein